MSASKSLLLGVLRIITPEEISELTTSSKGSRRIPLNEVIENYFNGENIDSLFMVNEEDAEVIELDASSTEKSGAESFDNNCTRMLSTYLENPVKFRKELCDTLTDESGRTNDTSIFILNEKERFKKNQRKLKTQEVKSLYQDSKKVVVSKVKDADIINDSTNSGVLVNKKQL